MYSGGWGGVLPYKGLIGTCSLPGYVFQDFFLKQGIDFIIFCLNQGIDFINFCLKQGIFLNSFVIANGLNKKEFQYFIIVLHRVWFWVKSEFCLKQGRKISDFCHKQGQGMRGRAAPPHPRIYRLPLRDSHQKWCDFKT